MSLTMENWAKPAVAGALVAAGASIAMGVPFAAQVAVLGVAMPAPIALGVVGAAASASGELIENQLLSGAARDAFGTLGVPVVTGGALIVFGVAVGVLDMRNLPALAKWGALGAASDIGAQYLYDGLIVPKYGA